MYQSLYEVITSFSPADQVNAAPCVAMLYVALPCVVRESILNWLLNNYTTATSNRGPFLYHDIWAPCGQVGELGWSNVVLSFKRQNQQSYLNFSIII